MYYKSFYEHNNLKYEICQEYWAEQNKKKCKDKKQEMQINYRKLYYQRFNCEGVFADTNYRDNWDKDNPDWMLWSKMF